MLGGVEQQAEVARHSRTADSMHSSQVSAVRRDERVALVGRVQRCPLGPLGTRIGFAEERGTDPTLPSRSQLAGDKGDDEEEDAEGAESRDGDWVHGVTPGTRSGCRRCTDRPASSIRRSRTAYGNS
ncbi:MAG TPA: hypothetical protein VEA38_01595 [Terriglobales bacterium]|nr:hypothetical protein [Terriglobales bacterium]